jgi:hypothetical protein
MLFYFKSKRIVACFPVRRILGLMKEAVTAEWRRLAVTRSYTINFASAMDVLGNIVHGERNIYMR